MHAKKVREVWPTNEFPVNGIIGNKIKGNDRKQDIYYSKKKKNVEQKANET